MLSVVAMEASYRRHVMQRIMLEEMPDFSVLLQLREDEPWPSVDEANSRFALLRNSVKTKASSDEQQETFLPFCEMLLADEYSYEIALQMHKVRKALNRKDSDSLSALWKLKQLLRNTPTLLTQMPEAMLQALRAVEKPEKPDTWGLIFLTQAHRIPCAHCKGAIGSENSFRVRCLCCPFGYLAHRSCVSGKRCLVCSTPYHLTKLKGH